MSVQSLVCVICIPLDLIQSINPFILQFHLCSKISYLLEIMKYSDEGDMMKIKYSEEYGGAGETFQNKIDRYIIFQL